MKTLYLFGAMLMAGISVNAQTYLAQKDFQDQSMTSGGWQQFIVTSTPGSYSWTIQDLGSPGNYYAVASGWNGSSADDTELWMVSGSFNLFTAINPELNFRNAENFGGPQLDLMISTDYNGVSDPTTQGTWTSLTSMANWSSGGFAWTNGGPVDLSAYNGNSSVYIAFVYTSDASNGASSWEIDEVEVTEPVAPTTASVYDIQNAAGDSPYMNQVVSTGGIVTAFNNDGYAIQAGTGAFSGVWVRDSVNSVSRGDSVLITGTVDEFFNFTQVEMITSFSLESSGNNEPAATVVTTSGANAEGWEGTKIQVQNAPCTLDNDGFGQWILNDGSGNVLIDNELYVYPSPTISNVYSVTGIGWYAFSEFKIQPRDINDIEDITSVEEFEAHVSLFPNPVNDVLNISSDKGFDMIQIFNGTGQMVMSVSVQGSQNISLDMSALSSGIYQVSIQSGSSRKVQRIIK